jgi:hypothetical protein
MFWNIAIWADTRGEKLLVVALRQYAYLVPYIEEADGYFLKTIIPSRKATRDYLRHSGH